MEKYIDLHVHTTASDGSMTPAEVVRHAVEKNLAAIAITDHDTVDGVVEALEEGRIVGIEVIPGIEISVDYEGEMHILGYDIDIHSQQLNSVLNRLRVFREQRNPKIVEKLNALGMSITITEVEEKAGDGIIGRPHIAQVMVEKGYVSSVDEAFIKYLDTGKPAYVERQKLSPKEGIHLIKRAGGLAVLAHPIYLKKNDIELENLLAELIDFGLDGIEGYYSEYPPEVNRKYLELAEKCNLVVTGGSDFHGRSKPGLELGKGYGILKVPYELLERLKRNKEEDV